MRILHWWSRKPTVHPRYLAGEFTIDDIQDELLARVVMVAAEKIREAHNEVICVGDSFKFWVQVNFDELENCPGGLITWSKGGER